MTNNSALMTSCVSTAHCSLHFACHPFDGLWCVVLAAVLWAQIARVLLLLAFATNCCCLLSLLTFITFIVIFSTKQAVNLLQTLLHYFFCKAMWLSSPPLVTATCLHACLQPSSPPCSLSLSSIHESELYERLPQTDHLVDSWLCQHTIRPCGTGNASLWCNLFIIVREIHFRLLHGWSFEKQVSYQYLNRHYIKCTLQLYTTNVSSLVCAANSENYYFVALFHL